MDVTGKKLMLVENDARLLLRKSETLRAHGYEVFTESDGERAITTIRDDPEISLALVDVELDHHISGPETAERMLEIRPLPIVFLASHTDMDAAKMVREIPRYGFIPKDSGDCVLLTSIELALELFSVRQENDLTLSALRESEEKYRAAFQTSPDSININAMDGTYIDINEGFTALTGYTRKDVIGVKSTDLNIWVIPEDRVRLVEGLKQNGVVNNLESEFRSKDGTVRTALMSARVIKLNGKPNILSITRDISERKQTEQRTQELLKEKELLLREVHHRVKNNMASIASLLSLQANAAKTKEASSALREMGGRIRSIQIVYEKLFYSQDFKSVSFGDYLNDMLEVIESSLPQDTPISLKSSLEDVPLEANRIFPLGLIANELVTNAIKHAFPGDRSGKILVSLKLARPNSCELIVADDGQGLPESINPQKSPGFGLTLVSALTAQIGGTLTILRGPGTEVHIVFPVP